MVNLNYALGLPEAEGVRSEDGRVERPGFSALSVVRRVSPRPDGQGVDRGTACGEAKDDQGDDLPAHQQAQGDGPPRRGQRERARHDPEGLSDPVWEPLESLELRRIERRDRDGELSQDRGSPGEACGAAEVKEWQTTSSP